MNPSRPNPSANAFIDLWVKLIGMGTGFPYEVLVAQFNSSYSASRAALLRAWRFASIRQHWLVHHYLAPERAWVIAESVAKRWLNCPGFFDDPFLRAAWCDAQWVGDAKGSINPLDEARAAVIRIGAQITTGEEEVLAYSGGSFARNVETAGRERAMRLEAGVIQEPLTDTQPASVQP